MRLPQLTELLSYRNDSVIKRFCFKNPHIPPAQGEQIFKDLLGWLWLSVNRAQRQLATHMIAPLILLDQMWHEFILHTQDYTQFCEDFFNQYLHHKVESVGEEYVLSTEELSAFLSDSYDCLGEEWVLRNFSSVLAEPAS